MSEYLVEDTVKCSECSSRNLTRDETRGEVVCDDCGLVLEDKVIDQGAEDNFKSIQIAVLQNERVAEEIPSF